MQKNTSGESNEDLELKQQKVEFAENVSSIRCLKFSDCGRFLAVVKSHGN